MLVWQTLGQALVLGLGAGITPGPLLGLIINQDLRLRAKTSMLGR